MNYIKIFDNFSYPQERKEFTENEISYYQRMWDFLPERYRNNRFFKSIWNQAKSKRSLSKKQWTELEFLLRNGKSRYESGSLPNNY
jgi:hypothetical protein